MDSHKSTPPPAASSNARSNPFAYQTRILERSSSRGGSSSFSLSNASPATPAGATGLAHSGSVRRYPMPHRHTASLDPQRQAELRGGLKSDGTTSSPTAAQGPFGSNGSLASSSTSPSTSSASLANRSPTQGSPITSNGSFPTPTARGVGGRPFSMPPAPRDNTPGSRPLSPTKSIYERPVSPTKGYGSPASPDKDAHGSFWSSTSQSQHHTPSSVHLGGVSDLKRSSVGALKMMRELATRSDVVPPGSVNEPGHTRMTVGRSHSQRTKVLGPDGGDVPDSPLSAGRNGRGRLDSLGELNGLRQDDDYTKPSRPGRMESEDNAEGEIVLPGITTGAEDVAGLSGRIRLTRQGAGPAMPLGRISATSSLPFSGNSKWMDTQRHLLQAYEYLCHCGEAKEWMEHCVGEELGAVVDMENEMRNGIFVAKLARKFEPECVPRICVHPKLQYRHTDNINYFFRFVEKVGLPSFFHFELTDLYEKKNFPKVVYCIHALSHVLARQGRALKVGNLVGKLEFTDDQLQQTQRGLDATGVTMPSFGGVGRALATEMNVEPEPEPETEEERQDRELLENIESVIVCQTGCRAFLARQDFKRMMAAEARRREEEARRLAAEAEARRLTQEAEERRLAAEAEARRLAAEEEARRKAAEEEARRKAEEEARRKAEEERLIAAWAPKLQAQVCGVLSRRSLHRKQAALRTSTSTYVGLQALARAKLARQAHQQTLKGVQHPDAHRAVEQLQARIRGALLRRNFFKNISALDAHEAGTTGLQAQVRGLLARKSYEDLIFRLADATEDIIKLQSTCRAVLAKRQLLNTIRGLRSSTSSITAVQAQIRGILGRRSHKQMSSALQRVEVKQSVGGLQAFARAALARRQHQEQRKQLDFVTPDVVGVQAAIRGFLARREYYWWRNHLIQSEPVAIHLQSLVRGLLERRKFWNKLRHYHEHMDKVVKIQSLFRGKQQGEQYRSLTMGKNVPVGTIKNFGHLLNDSDYDFEDEIEVERLRKFVVRSIRENQTLDNDVSELDTKIALLVKNKIGIEELIKAKNERGLLGQRDAAAAVQRRNMVLVAAGDPFADQTLDRATRRKLELYQELFYALQTRPEYLARLFGRVGKIEMSDKQKKQVEKIVLTLFGYAQKAREEYLLLKLFQRCVAEELNLVNTVQEFIRGNAQFIKLVVQYNRGAKERKYLRDLLSPLVRGIMDDDGLDLETDPCAIYRGTINQEEMQTGQPSRRPLDVNFHEALADPGARTIFIRHLQSLRGTTEAFLEAIVTSTRKMPFGIRYIAREVFRALQSKFPNEPEDALIKVVGHLVYYRYLNPAIVAPEGFDVIETLVGPVQRKNLAEVSKMLTQIAVGRLFSDDNPYLQPLNDYVSQASARFTKWLFAVVDVQDAELQFSADEFLDHTVPQKPVIYISPNEIYSMHLLLTQQIDHLAPLQDDPLRTILSELGPPPVSNTQELNTARDSEITFELASRMTTLKDPEAETKALFVETKRLILSLLKVQSGKTLVDVFVAPVTEQDELTWEEIVSLEVAADRQRQRGQRPPAPQQGGPRLEDVRRLSFAELKARTLENMLRLEKLGKVRRENAYQDMLNAIAIDIRNKHRKRIQRHNEKVAMHITLTNLAEKKKYLEEQIESYNSYIDASMQTMQKKGKKRFVLPFTQQYFHLRNLKATGKVPKHGSFKYTAARLHEKGVLLSIDQFSDKQLDQISLTISSDEVGLFTIDASVLGVSGGSVDLRIEDLLEAQFNNQQTMTLMDGMVKVNINLLVHLINRKFYA